MARDGQGPSGLDRKRAIFPWSARGRIARHAGRGAQVDSIELKEHYDFGVWSVAAKVGDGRLMASAPARAQGRVVEIRVARLLNPADVESLHSSVRAAIERAGIGATICADCRRTLPLSGPVATAWSRHMRSANRSIARSALLLDPSNTMFNLQLERIVRCAGNPTRRLFADVDELSDWLASELTEWERQALRAFLSEGDRPCSLVP